MIDDVPVKCRLYGESQRRCPPPPEAARQAPAGRKSPKRSQASEIMLKTQNKDIDDVWAKTGVDWGLDNVKTKPSFGGWSVVSGQSSGRDGWIVESGRTRPHPGL